MTSSSSGIVPLARRLVAEAIGTFVLVFAGCGAIMVDAKTHALGHVGVAFTFGLVVMAMIYAIGHVSGAHFNGAVTLAFALTRHFPWPRAFAYWGAQLTGGGPGGPPPPPPPPGARDLSPPGAPTSRGRCSGGPSCAALWAPSPTWARRSPPAPTASRSSGRSC